MKSRRFVRTTQCSPFVVILVAAPLLVQGTPDLSGRWVLEERSPRAPDVPRVISVSQSIARTNVRGETMKPFVKELTVARELDDGSRSDMYRVGTVGGSTPGMRTRACSGWSVHAPPCGLGRARPGARVEHFRRPDCEKRRLDR